MHRLLPVACFFIFSCHQTTALPKNNGTVATSDSQAVNILKVQANVQANTDDSLEQSFIDGKYFMPFIVRLQKNTRAFIWIDSGYAANALKDPKAEKLYFQTNQLTPKDREGFYNTIISALPKQDVEVFRLAWNIKEVKREGLNFDGGINTLVTLISKKPTAGDPYYSVEVKHYSFWRLGSWYLMGYLKINPINHKILVLDDGEGYLPLAEWRRLHHR